MFIRNFRQYREEATGDENTGGGATVEQLQEQLADMTKQFAAVKGKSDELLTEAKQAKAAKREAEENAAKRTHEKALAAKDFEQLHKSSELEREKALTELTTLKSNIANEKTVNAAMKIAASISEGDNSELLTEFISKRLRYTDNELKVLNTAGELTVSTVDDLKKEFQADPKYSALLTGNKSTGGGASGNNSGGAASNNKMSSTQRIAEGLKAQT